MKESPTLAALAAALAEAQGQIENAKRENSAKVEMKNGGSYTYNYSDLASVMEVCRGPLAKSGLCVVQFPTSSLSEGEGADVSIVTKLMHKSGEFIEADPLTLHVVDSRPQTIGSGITYARRYAYTAILGVAFETDDDGSAASGVDGTTEPRQREELPVCPACGMKEAVIKDQYSPLPGGLFCWPKSKKLAGGGCGNKWNPTVAAATASDEKQLGQMMDQSQQQHAAKPAANGNGKPPVHKEKNGQTQLPLGGDASPKANPAQPAKTQPAQSQPAQTQTAPAATGNPPAGGGAGFEQFKTVLRALGFKTRGEFDAAVRVASESRLKSVSELEANPTLAGDFAQAIKDAGLNKDQILAEDAKARQQAA